MVLPVVALHLAALRCGALVNKALRGPGGGCAQHHGWCCFWCMKARPRGARSVAAKLLTKDEARRIAANAAKLPELVLRC